MSDLIKELDELIKQAFIAQEDREGLDEYKKVKSEGSYPESKYVGLSAGLATHLHQLNKAKKDLEKARGSTAAKTARKYQQLGKKLPTAAAVGLLTGLGYNQARQLADGKRSATADAATIGAAVGGVAGHADATSRASTKALKNTALLRGAATGAAAGGSLYAVWRGAKRRQEVKDDLRRLES